MLSKLKTELHKEVALDPMLVQFLVTIRNLHLVQTM